MKKIILALVTVLYMGVSSGIAMDVHYCMGKVSQVDLYARNYKCKVAKKMNCCGEQHKFYKLSNAHQNTYNNLSFAAVITPVIIPYQSYNWQYTTDISYKAVANNSPPIYARPSVCILNCIFKI